MSGEIQLRPAGVKDMREVALINVASWKEAYRGQVPQDYLDSLNPEIKRTRFEQTFDLNFEKGCRTILAVRDNVIIGYISYGPSRDAAFAGYAEIYAVYILPCAWGCGIGRMLFAAAVDDLTSRGFNQLFVLALQTNTRALNAYCAWGGVVHPSFEVSTEIGGQSFLEAAVVFQLRKTPEGTALPQSPTLR